MPLFNQHWMGGERPLDSSPLGIGGDGDGTLRDYMTVDQEGVVAIPAHLSFEEAACLPCAALTAWSGVTGNGAPYPGDVVLTQRSGGVSVFALQFAKLFGARVISTSSSDEKCAHLRKLGADETVNYVEFPEWDLMMLRPRSII
jgi:NADPH:quinone reductase-like Zn-dependent oxidoreductase